MSTAIAAGRRIYKKCDAPIGPSDLQASKNNEWRLPPYKKMYERSEFDIGVLKGARVATGED